MLGSVARETVMGVCAMLGVIGGEEPFRHFLSVDKQPPLAIIALSNLEILDGILQLDYAISNASAEDIWICGDMHRRPFEVYFEPSTETLMIRRRLPHSGEGISMFPPPDFSVTYARLGPGERRTESLLVPLPARYQGVFATTGLSGMTDNARVNRLAVEIAFYAGNLFERFLQYCIEQEEADRARDRVRLPEALVIMMVNEGVRHRGEQVRIPLSRYDLPGAEILRISVNAPRITYIGSPRQQDCPNPPRVQPCTRAKIAYHPSMLQYFYPSESQRALLSPSERQYLESQQTTVVTDPDHLRFMASEIARGQYGGIIVEGGQANVDCYVADEQTLSFIIYADRSIQTEDRQCFSYPYGLSSLRKLTPQIQAFELRLRCAGNLDTLWYRLRLHHLSPNVSVSGTRASRLGAYPGSQKWCDAIIHAYDGLTSMPRGALVEPYSCPSADEGKCHYAMNPNCRPDSPEDMVLLFETEAGWNQHGGPELFTFDNHDPKGGCVLLNDGTVKFIRTEEELHALRWK